MKILIGQNKKGFFFAIIAILLNSALGIAQASLLGIVFDHLENILQPWLMSLLALYLVCTLLVSLYIDFAKESLKRSIRRMLLRNGIKAYMQLDEFEFEKKEMSRYINEMTSEVDLVIDQYVTPMLSTFGLIVSFLLGSVYFIFLDWRMLAFLYGGSFITLGINKLCQGRLARNQEQMLATRKDWIAALQGFYRNFSVIKDYGLEEKESRELDETGERNVQACFKAGIELANLDSIDLEIGFILFFGLTILCGTLFAGTVSAGIAVTALQLTNSIVNPIINFTTIWNRLNASRSVLDRLLALDPDRKDRKGEEITEPVRTIEIDAPEINVDNTTLLCDIHLRFEKGKKYMIVGPSGCGKTTLLRTLKGTIPSSAVRINGEMNRSMKEQLGVISQNPALFSRTVTENIVLKKNASRQQVRCLLDQVGLGSLDPDRRLRLDHDTLSGGEQQRIQLARLLMQHRPWLVLDEAFSALDHETTRRLERICLSDPSFSVISVCHKPILENMPYYNEIIVMEKGTVREILAPDEWIRKNRLLENSL